MRTHLHFTRVNKIETMYGRSRVNVKVEPRSSFMFKRGLSYIASVSFTHANFTCVCREKLRDRTARHLCVTNKTGLLLVRFVFTAMLSGPLQKISINENEVRRKLVSNKIIVTLVTKGLPSSFLPRPVA